MSSFKPFIFIPFIKYYEYKYINTKKPCRNTGFLSYWFIRDYLNSATLNVGTPSTLTCP